MRRFNLLTIKQFLATLHPNHIQIISKSPTFNFKMSTPNKRKLDQAFLSTPSPKRTRNLLTIDDKLKIIQLFGELKNKREVARRMNCTESYLRSPLVHICYLVECAPYDLRNALLHIYYLVECAFVECALFLERFMRTQRGIAVYYNKRLRFS